MDKHQLGDIVLAYTPHGTVMIGIISDIQESEMGIYNNLYSVKWFGRIVEEISNSYYTHYNVTRLKKNLIKYFESDKT